MISRLMAVVALITLVGCDRDDLYGRHDHYALHIDYEIDVEMPPNAPFISEQFRGENESNMAAHPGMDVWAKIRTPILAAAEGEVIASYYEPMYGNRVEISHGKDARGVYYKTVYMHLKDRTVEKGAVVERGQQVGTMGATGILGMFVHLHFEVHEGPRAGDTEEKDPQLFWVRGPGKVTCFEPGLTIPQDRFRTTYPVICR